MHPHRTWERRCTVVGSVLPIALKENDIRLPISANIKVSEQCGIAASKGNQIIGFMR